MKFITGLAAAVMLCACSASSAPNTTTQSNLAGELPALTGEYVWTMDEAASALTFSAVHNSREFKGKFGEFSAAIKLNPANPANGEIHAIIGLASVDAGDRDRNANLPGKDWFYIESFPTATFVSKDIRALSGDNYEARGNLTLKGVEKPLSLTFSLSIDGNTALAKGGVTFSRRDFGIGEGPDFETEDWVKFPVSVSIDVTASR